ncbi:hypothetical protein CLOHYLEM_07274 [[Clostridium] hylemonae DSM 15053]|uniref:Uncharacterized protein n=1 Tax=[Clostridium] hylemonae DSM 15053 TaxID=553973 RepID=C0C599_9FIRM|nr:hypothetical protein CLOHYLEM_07274 [[Clostridium] hylemonae DSM 15053]
MQNILKNRKMKQQLYEYYKRCCKICQYCYNKNIIIYTKTCKIYAKRREQK